MTVTKAAALRTQRRRAGNSTTSSVSSLRHLIEMHGRTIAAHAVFNSLLLAAGYLLGLAL